MKNFLFNKICIIGVGRMGSALLDGFLRGGYSEKNFILKVRSEVQKSALAEQGFKAQTDLQDVHHADAICIAVKPPQVYSIIDPLKNILKDSPKPIISLCVGVTYSDFEKMLGKKYPIFRVMPNIFIRMNSGNLLFSPNLNITTLNHKIKNLIGCLGKVFTVDENHLSHFTLDSSTIPGVLLTRMIVERLENLSVQEYRLALELLISGIQGLIKYLDHLVRKEKMRSDQALHYVIKQIVSPAGRSDTFLDILNRENFWKAFTKASEVYERQEKDLYLTTDSKLKA